MAPWSRFRLGYQDGGSLIKQIMVTSKLKTPILEKCMWLTTTSHRKNSVPVKINMQWRGMEFPMFTRDSTVNWILSETETFIPDSGNRWVCEDLSVYFTACFTQTTIVFWMVQVLTCGRWCSGEFSHTLAQYIPPYVQTVQKLRANI